MLEPRHLWFSLGTLRFSYARRRKSLVFFRPERHLVLHSKCYVFLRFLWVTSVFDTQIIYSIRFWQVLHRFTTIFIGFSLVLHNLNSLQRTIPIYFRRTHGVLDTWLWNIWSVQWRHWQRTLQGPYKIFIRTLQGLHKDLIRFLIKTLQGPYEELIRWLAPWRWSRPCALKVVKALLLRRWLKVVRALLLRRWLQVVWGLLKVVEGGWRWLKVAGEDCL